MSNSNERSGLLMWILIPVLVLLALFAVMDRLRDSNEPVATSEEPRREETETITKYYLPFSSPELKTQLQKEWQMSFSSPEKGDKSTLEKGQGTDKATGALLLCDIYEQSPDQLDWVEFMVKAENLPEDVVDEVTARYFTSLPTVLNADSKMEEARRWIAAQVEQAKTKGNTVSAIAGQVKYTMYGTAGERTLIVTLGPPPPVVFLDGRQLSFDVPPIIEDGRTLVPLRAIFEAMGATVTWDDTTSTAIGVKGDTTVILPVGSTEPTINGAMYKLEVPGRIIKGRTLAPLRFVGEAFGGTVTWDGATNKITITTASR